MTLGACLTSQESKAVYCFQTLPAVATHNGQSGHLEPASPLAWANASRTPRHALPVSLQTGSGFTQKPPHLLVLGATPKKLPLRNRTDQIDHEAVDAG